MVRKGQMKISEKNKKMIIDYLLAVASAAVMLGVAAVTDFAPQYAVIVGAVAAPAIKWASKHSKDYGRGTE